MKKVGIFLYGVIAYIILLVIFFYAIGYVGNFAVPKSIDSDDEGLLNSSILTNALLLSVFAIQYSVQWPPIKSVVFEMDNAIAGYAFRGLFFIGWLIVLISTFMINFFEWFGLQQVKNYLKSKMSNLLGFNVIFFYGVVRHPIMLGILIAFWATPIMSVGHLFFSIMITLYIYIAVKYLEEKDLRKFIGSQYKAYQKENFKTYNIINTNS